MIGVSSRISSIIPNLVLASDFKNNNIFSSLYSPIGNGTEIINKVEYRVIKILFQIYRLGRKKGLPDPQNGN